MLVPPTVGRNAFANTISAVYVGKFEMNDIVKHIKRFGILR